MDIASSVYGFFGTSDPGTLLLDLLVAAMLAVSIVYLALELYRIYGEYAGKEAPVSVVAAAPPVEAVKAPEAPKVVVPAIEVVKGTLQESMMTLTQKYRLESLTLASQDGLVIASTGKAPEQDAAVYSGLFQELYRVKHEPYFYVESKDVSLYSIEGGAQNVVGVAHRKGALAPDEAKAIRDDSRRVIDRFAAGH